MSLADQFPEITKRDQPLAPFTHLKIGGPAEFLVQPRTVDELNAVLAACQPDRVPVRMPMPGIAAAEFLDKLAEASGRVADRLANVDEATRRRARESLAARAQPYVRGADIELTGEVVYLAAVA